MAAEKLIFLICFLCTFLAMTDGLCLGSYASCVVPLSNRTTFACQRSDFTTIPCQTNYRFLAMIQYLDLSFNDITMVPGESLRRFYRLHSLDLSWNSISVVSRRAFEGLSNLVSLNLNHNLVTQIICGTFSFTPKLTSLQISNNSMSVIGSLFLRGLSGLKTLDLSNNAVTQIYSTTFLSQINSLRVLNISGNMLNTLEGMFSTFDTCAIEQLDVSRNVIGILSLNHLRSLVRLRRLDLHSNQIAVILTNSFVAVQRLTYLDLSNNMLKSFPLFSRLSQYLEYINLGSNNINWIDPNGFQGVTLLKYLGLSENKITTIDSVVLSPLAALQSLELHGNLISELDPAMFLGMSQLRTLTLYPNQLDCCAVNWAAALSANLSCATYALAGDASAQQHCAQCSTPQPMTGMPATAANNTLACKDVLCPITLPTLPPYASAGPCTGQRFNASCNLTCASGFVIDRSAVISCGADNQWHTRAQCKDVAMLSPKRYLSVNRTYAMSRTRLSWVEAQAACQLRGGNLTVMGGQGEEDTVKALYLSSGVPLFVWIGLLARNIMGNVTLQWADGSVLDSHKAVVDGPMTTEGCMAMAAAYSKQHWIHNNCSTVRHFICEYP